MGLEHTLVMGPILNVCLRPTLSGLAMSLSHHLKYKFRIRVMLHPQPITQPTILDLGFGGPHVEPSRDSLKSRVKINDYRMSCGCSIFVRIKIWKYSITQNNNNSETQRT